MKLFPTGRASSAYKIDYERLAASGIRGIIFDIDNTLVPHGAPATEEAIRLFSNLHSLGLKTCLISNNGKERVKSFADAVGSQYQYKAGKPSKKGYVAGMEMMGTDAKSTLFVGDQIYTDVWGANRAGIPSCLVKPIHPKEEIQIVLKRILEKPLLWAFSLSGRAVDYEKR